MLRLTVADASNARDFDLRTEGEIIKTAVWEWSEDDV